MTKQNSNNNKNVIFVIIIHNWFNVKIVVLINIVINVHSNVKLVKYIFANAVLEWIKLIKKKNVKAARTIIFDLNIN